MSQSEAKALLAAMRTQHMERIADVIEEELDRQIAWADAAVERADKFMADSVTLNAIGWKLAQALGDAGPDDTETYGDPEEQLDRLIVERNRWEQAAIDAASEVEAHMSGLAADARVRAAEAEVARMRTIDDHDLCARDYSEAIDRAEAAEEERDRLKLQVQAQSESHNRQMNAYAVETDNLRQLLHAKESWIEGAKTDIQSLEDEVSRLARPNGLRLVSDLTLARNEFARLRKALVEIVNVLGPDEVLAGEGLVHEAHDALRAAKEALR